MWLQHNEFQKDFSVFHSEADGVFNVIEGLFAIAIFHIMLISKQLCVFGCVSVWKDLMAVWILNLKLDSKDFDLSKQIQTQTKKCSFNIHSNQLYKMNHCPDL